MTGLVLGVIGHVDHGKTALVRALTGTDTDRLPEEKRRGISIALGFAHFTVDGVAVDLIDMPGHERFVRTMVAGATGIDAVLLVTAANEGIKPQTREHVDIAALLGLRRAIVVVSKADLVAPARTEAVAAEAQALLRASGVATAATVLTSASTGQGIDALRAAIAGLITDALHRADRGVPFLPIDRAFSLTGHGTVVTGTLRGGKLTTADALELLPIRRPVRLRALQVHGHRVARAEPGQRVALNLRDVDVADVPRGAALAPPGALPPSTWLTVQLRATEDAPSLKTTATLQALLGTEEVAARLRLLDRDALEPGETALAQLHLAAPVAIPAREHLILRLISPPRTVAGGRILEAEATRQRRHDPGVLARLTVLATADPAGIVIHELAAAGPRGTTLQRLARLTGTSAAAVAAMLQREPALIGRTGLVVLRAALADVEARLVAELQSGPRARAALGSALADAGSDVLDEALARLIQTGRVREQGGLFARPAPEADRARADADSRAVRNLAQALRDGGLTPPAPDPAAPRRLLEALVRDGVLVRAHDTGQKRDVLFHRDAIETAQRHLRPLLAAPPGLRVAEIGAALGISRKYSVPLLEHLDATGFTRRVGERRVLAGGSG